jgi:hypothetical protein
MIQTTPSLDGRTCDVRDYGQCKRPAVVRASYGAWWPQDHYRPEGLPDPSTLFVGACDIHLESLRVVAASNGAEVEELGQSDAMPEDSPVADPG